MKRLYDARNMPLAPAMLVIAAAMLAVEPAALADTSSATLTISATVVADCTVSVDKSTLDLGSVKASTLQGKSANAALDDMSGTVTVTSTCAGTTKAMMTVSTTTVADKNIVASSPEGASADIMRFGLKINDTTKEFGDTKSVTQEISDASLSTGHTDTLTFSALAGASASKATAGSYSATVTVKVEPE